MKYHKIHFKRYVLHVFKCSNVFSKNALNYYRLFRFYSIISVYRFIIEDSRCKTYWTQIKIYCFMTRLSTWTCKLRQHLFHRQCRVSCFVPINKYFVEILFVRTIACFRVNLHVNELDLSQNR